MALLDRDYQIQLSEIEPEFKTLVEHHNFPKIDFDNADCLAVISQIRVNAARTASGSCPEKVKETDLQYPTADGSSVRARLYQPYGLVKHPSPLVIMFHGGCFCLGGPESEDLTCRNLVQAFGAVCLSAGYRLAPEFKFPHAPNDAWDIFRWAAAHAAAWNADPQAGFIVGGTSAGGCLAATLAHRARDEQFNPPLTGQYLAAPMLLPESQVPERYKAYVLSYEQNRHAPVLPVAAIHMFNQAYQPVEEDNVLHAPFNYPTGHRGLPPTFIQVDGLDPLRDGGLIYERVLNVENDIKTKLDVYPGLPHAHWAFFPHLESSAKFRRDQINGFGWLLGSEPDLSKVMLRATCSTP